MIQNDLLSGVPLLILANKQDLPDVMGVRDIKPVFQQSGGFIGRRDCLTIPVSALTGLVILYNKNISSITVYKCCKLIFLYYFMAFFIFLLTAKV